eukprot:TRINITY_DN3029_c0_g1_i2.p1 TRINITY_DN3029_c0_g1~~TRINITY_DN3029_c0_g1_i2.p1  ORF type:complete len:221 (+),score=35.68 TRINITY_DN3029_c0_g1_i2:200-862(+)
MTPPMGMQGGMNVNVSGGNSMNRGNGQGVTNVINLTGNSNGSMRNAQTYPNGVSVNGGNMMSGQALRPGQNIIAGQKNGQNFRGSYTNNTSVTVDSNRSKGTPSVNLNYFTSDCLNRERLGQIMKELCAHPTLKVNNFSEETVELLTEAAEIRLKTILEELISLSKHRTGQTLSRYDMEISTDPYSYLSADQEKNPNPNNTTQNPQITYTDIIAHSNKKT